MEKLYTSKTFLKMVGGRMHTLHSAPVDPPLVISRVTTGTHQKINTLLLGYQKLKTLYCGTTKNR